MKKGFWTIVTLLCTNSCMYAQEWNIGVHLDPVFTMPILSGKSVRNEDISVSFLRPGIKAGINFNYRLENMSVEFSPAFVRRELSVYNNKSSYSGQEIFYRSTMPSNSILFPLAVNFLLDRHDENTRYDMYLVAGMEYEMNQTDSAASFASSTNGGVTVDVKGKYNGLVFQNIVAPVIGVKINAILKNVGLIDYGLSFHLPLTVSGPYNVDAKLTNGPNTTAQSAALYASNAYIDIKLCYYFFSIGKKLKRVKYRIV